MSETIELIYDVPRLLDEREALRAELWHIAFRAERAQNQSDKNKALEDIEKWSMEVLNETS